MTPPDDVFNHFIVNVLGLFSIITERIKNIPSGILSSGHSCLMKISLKRHKIIGISAQNYRLYCSEIYSDAAGSHFDLNVRN